MSCLPIGIDHPQIIKLLRIKTQHLNFIFVFLILYCILCRLILWPNIVTFYVCVWWSIKILNTKNCFRPNGTIRYDLQSMAESQETCQIDFSQGHDSINQSIVLSFIKFLETFGQLWGAAVAQWIRLHHPSCRPGFESQAQHLCFYQFELGRVEKTKNKQKTGTFLKNFGPTPVTSLTLYNE